MTTELLAFIAGGLVTGSTSVFIAWCCIATLREKIHALESALDSAWEVAGYRKDGEDKNEN